MKVLLATDGSTHSEAAVARVAEGPWPTGTVVRVLTVVHPPIPLFMEPTLVIAAAHQQQIEELRQRGTQVVHAAAQKIEHGSARVDVTTKVLEGSPQHLIVEEARDWDADLIVLGSHGYGRLQRMVLGSVAGAVVANAPCSVQVVRPRHLFQAESEA